jgi:hypothetical protein
MGHNVDLDQLVRVGRFQMRIDHFRRLRRLSGMNHPGGAQFALDAAETWQGLKALLT